MSTKNIFLPKSTKEVLIVIKDSVKAKLISISKFNKLTEDYSRDERRIVKKIKKLKSGKFNYVLPNFWLYGDEIAQIINPLLYRKVESGSKPYHIKLKKLELLNFGNIALIRKRECNNWRYWKKSLYISNLFWLLKTKELWEDGIL